MTSSFKRLANELLAEGMKLEAFNNLAQVCFELVRAKEGLSAAYKEEADLINRTRLVEYPHGKYIEWEEGKEYAF